MRGRAIPEPHVEETETTRSVTLGSWTIIAENHPISNAAHLDRLGIELGIPMPEMTFGHNLIKLKHRESGWEYQFDTLHSLKEVKNGLLEDGDGAVKVRYAEEWLKSRYFAASSPSLSHILQNRPELADATPADGTD